MVITVSGRHLEITPALKAHAEEKAGKLTKFFDRIQEIEVVIDAGKDTVRVEMIVSAEHNSNFVAHHDNADAYAGIDGCAAKMERQLSEHKKMHRNRKHPA